MDFGRAAMDPSVAASRLAARLEEAGLPRFVSAEHDSELDLLKVSWSHGVTIYMDLRHDGIVEPIDEHERAMILGLQPCCEECAKAGQVPSSADEPRRASTIAGRGITAIPSTDSHDAPPDR
jgi:hypothetical protein